MDLPEYKTALDAIILISTAGGAAWAMKKALFDPFFRRCKNCKNWFERMDKGLTAIERIEAQFYNNGGSSLRDAVDNIQSRLTFMENRENVLLDDHELGIFICDENGANSFVSRSYAHMLGCTKAELLGRDWENFLCEEGAGEYKDLWETAFKNFREIKTVICMKTMSGAKTCMSIQIIPLNKSTDKIKRFMGKIKKNACLGEKCPNRGQGCCASIVRVAH